MKPPDIDVGAFLSGLAAVKWEQAPCEACGGQKSRPPSSTEWRCNNCEAIEQKRYFAESALNAFRSRFPKRYRGAAFDTSELLERVKDRAAIAKAKELVGEPMVCLIGPSGVGKTTLAVAMARALYKPGKVEMATFAFAPDLCAARAQQRLGDGEADEIADAKRSMPLVLDDLGQEPDNTWAKVLIEVIDHRHRCEQITIVTTFLTSKAVATRYGDGFARRLFENGYLEMKSTK